MTQTIRIRENQLPIEFEWNVGAIPVEDEVGKEVISKYKTSLHTVDTIKELGKHVFYTDSNGREFLRRVFNTRPTYDADVQEPIAGNYYPLTTGMFIQDKTQNVQLSVLVDRAQGGGAIQDGNLEFMIHRRLLVDDSRGVEEPLNETTIGMTHYPDWERQGDGITVSGRHYVLLSSLNEGMQDVRSWMDRIYAPVLPLYVQHHSNEKESIESVVKRDASKPLLSIPSLQADLAVTNSVHVLTLERTEASKLLIRLAHQFAINEDYYYSQAVTIDLFKWLQAFHPITAVELTLSANQNRAEQLANKVHWNTADEKQVKTLEKKAKLMESLPKLAVAADGSLTYFVTINPMEIRTFEVTLQQK